MAENSELKRGANKNIKWRNHISEEPIIPTAIRKHGPKYIKRLTKLKSGASFEPTPKVIKLKTQSVIVEYKSEWTNKLPSIVNQRAGRTEKITAELEILPSRGHRGTKQRTQKSPIRGISTTRWADSKHYL